MMARVVFAQGQSLSVLLIAIGGKILVSIKVDSSIRQRCNKHWQGRGERALWAEALRHNPVARLRSKRRGVARSGGAQRTDD